MALRSHRFQASPVLEACVERGATVQPGVVSGAVARVQQALMDLGYALRDYGPDGVFGHETGEALATFKAEVGMEPNDPVIDGRTIAALDERLVDEAVPPADDADEAEPPTDEAVPPTDEADEADEAAGPRAPSSIEPELATAVGAATTTARYACRAVDVALGQAAEGAHHLHGAGGARPGGSDGALLRSAGVSLAPPRTDLARPAVFAAECRLRGRHVCGGRFDRANGGLAGGRPAGRTDTDLLVYLAGLASLPLDRWQPFFQFFSPRRIEGQSVHRRIVWGEDCRGKRHFDGEGFVNWCLEQAVGGRYPIGFDISTWGTAASGTIAVALDDPPEKGDIVIRNLDGDWTHIGLLVGDNDTGEPGDLGTVVLAEQTTVGVVQRRFRLTGWTLRRRPTALLLHD